MKCLSKIMLLSLLYANVATATGYRINVLPQIDLGSIRTQALLGKSHDPSNTLFWFLPNYGEVAKVTPTVEDFVDEQSIYSATIEFARKRGGKITNEFIDKIPDYFYESAAKLGMHANINVRLHDLNLEIIPVGHDLYPAVPGWHADGEYRKTYFSQPDLSYIPVSYHAVGTTSTRPQGVSNTRFLDTAIQMEIVKDMPDSVMWADMHSYVEELESYEFSDIQDGNLAIFDARTLHKAMPVKESGKRLFFRVSMWHKPNLGDVGQPPEEIGQISKQDQLYLLPKRGFKEQVIEPARILPPDQKVIGSFNGTAQILELAQEQNIFGATIAEIKRDGGDIAKRLAGQIPSDFATEGYVPVVDMMIFRLNPGYRPFFPNYEGLPQSVNWHLPHLGFQRELIESDDFLLGVDDYSTAATAKAEQYKELWMAVSSHEDGVNVTEFSGRVRLEDGMVLLTSASSPRRELPTINRGWRLMMRVRLVPEGKVEPSQLISQQYVNPGSEGAGW